MPPFSKGAPPGILIVDDDLGFVVWLGLTLGASGFVTVPANNGTQAKQVIEELRVKVDLAIVNLALPGVSDLTSNLRRRNSAVKVIAIQGAAAGPSLTIKLDGSHSRAKAGWATLVRRVLGIERAAGRSDAT